MEKLEIKVNGSWVEVNEWIFRSWAGPRRIDNGDYAGTVFYLGSNEIVRHDRAPVDSEEK